MCELMPEQAHLTRYEISINDGLALLMDIPDTPLYLRVIQCVISALSAVLSF